MSRVHSLNHDTFGYLDNAILIVVFPNAQMKCGYSEQHFGDKLSFLYINL
jgi:hypothetical protein